MRTAARTRPSAATPRATALSAPTPSTSSGTKILVTDALSRPVPVGWLPFGSHAALEQVPQLEFSEALGPDQLPLWERHVGCTCDLPED